MGYRSDVCIGCGEKAYEIFKKAWEENNFKPQEVTKAGNIYYIKWEFVKWYYDYEEIRAIESVMRKLNDIPDNEMIGNEYKFVRIGEDKDDMETRYNTYNIDLYITRDFDMPSGDIIEI